MYVLAPRTQPAVTGTVPPPLRHRLIWITDEALRNGVHVMGGPGSGKSRLMGRVIAWLMLLRRRPTVIFDPTGGTIDNFLSKIIGLPEEAQRVCWPRVQYVDMGATDYVTPWPLYYRLHEQETLFAVAQRYLEVIKRIDPFLQTASVEGWNALAEIGTYTGMVLGALDLQITEAGDLIRRPQDWKERFEQALATDPEVAPAVAFFRSFQRDKRDQQRRSRAFVNKLLPFTADPSMQAMFGASRPGIDWEQVVGNGQTVLLDFRSELNLERRRFKMLWCYSSLLAYLKGRGMAGREQPLGLLIDEITQLLGFRTMEHSLMAEDLEELSSVIARNMGVSPLVLAHQGLSQVDERMRNILMQMGTQIIGVTPNPDDAFSLARHFHAYNPRWVKKTEPVWMNAPDPEWGVYNYPQIIDRRRVEFTPEEQLLLTADEFRQLGRFRFLVKVARGEGQIAGSVQRMSIEKLDRNQYPDEVLTAQARALLRRRDGVPVERILQDIRLRLSGGKQGKPAPTPSVTMEGDAHPIHPPHPPIQPQIQEEDEDKIILREEA